jgi:hypothetical protein
MKQRCRNLLNKLREQSVFLFLLITLLSSCDLLNKKGNGENERNEGKVLAKVNDQFLYSKDLIGLLGKNYSKNDSIELSKAFIDQWVRKELLLQKAETMIDPQNQEIQKKLLAYKHDLLIYDYENAYLKEKLDTIVKEKEIEEFYQKNINSFDLKENIIKGIFIKIPSASSKTEKIKQLVSSGKNTDMHELKANCLRFASDYFLDDTLWVNFDNLVRNSPFMEITAKTRFLETSRFSELKDSQFTYYLKINEYKIFDQLSPLDFVKEDIKSKIINKRKIDLIAKLEESIYKKAKEDKTFEIYSDK